MGVAIWLAWPAAVTFQGPASKQSLRIGGFAGAFVSVEPTHPVSLGGTVGVALKPIDHSTVRASIVDRGHSEPVSVEISLDLRANAAFTLTCQSEGESGSLNYEATVVQASGSGTLVSGDWSIRESKPRAVREAWRTRLSQMPATILTGPRISLGGGNKSPQNCLRVVIALQCRSRHEENITVDLLFQARAAQAD